MNTTMVVPIFAASLFWIIPAILLLMLIIWIFFGVVKAKGGSGHRQPGRTVYDESERRSER